MTLRQAAIFAGVFLVAAFDASAASLDGTWKGVYFIYPNLMGLELELNSASGGAVSGVLKYYPAVKQRSAFGEPPHGSYNVSGQYDDTNHTFILKPDAWIEKPQMAGQTAPLVGVLDVNAKGLAGVFEFRSMTAPVTFVLAADTKGDQLIADIIHSAYPAPLTTAQRMQQEEARRKQLMAQVGASTGNPEVQKMYEKAAARQAAGQRQRIEEQLEQMKRMKYPPGPAADAMERARENLQARLDALPGGSNDATKMEVWAAPPLDKMLDWLAPLKQELAALHLENAAMERIYIPAYNLFEDGYFKDHFGLTYEEMDTMKRKAVATFIGQHGQELYGVFMGRPFGNAGDFGAPDVTVSIFWQRVTRAWMGEMEASFAALPAEPDSFLHLTAAESTGKDVLPLLWSGEKQKFNTMLAEARTRLAGPALSLKVDQLIAAASGISGARDLTTWNVHEKELLQYASADDREKLQQRIDARIDEIVDGQMAGELQKVRDLGSGMRAVENGSAWYERFTQDYKTFLNRPAAENVLGTFKQRRLGDLAGVADEMTATIRAGYDKLSWDDSQQAEQGRMQFAGELAGHLGKWFVVPGDNSTETAKKVYAVASEVGGRVKDLLPPSKRAQLRFAASQTASVHSKGSARERSPVSVELLASADHADESNTFRELLPPPITDAGFDFGTDVCWAIFHGRFDEIPTATTGQPGLGSKLSAAIRNTNPQFHYAFISFVGISSERCGDRQIGPSTTVFWTTTTVYPDGSRVQDDSEKNPVKIPVVLADYYEDSYKIAQTSADADGIFGSNPFGYLQTFANMAQNGILSQAGTRADGSFSIAQADWERPILTDISELFTIWPAQSYGLWQFQENIKRFLKGEPSLQALWSQARTENGWTDLHAAASRNDAATVTKLLGRGTRVDVKDRYGYTPLHLAAMNGALDAMDALLRAGANVNARGNNGRTPLSFAVTFNATDAITRLLAAKASPDLADETGITPLQEAGQCGYESAVGLLLGAGASATATDKSGMNVVARAAAGDEVDVLKILLSHPGVNLQAKNKDGWNALHMAAKGNAKRAIGELVAKGLDVNGKTSQGYTPLHIAAMNGATDAIDALIIRGADLQARDAAGKTALDEAIASNNEPVILALRRQGQPAH